MADRRATAPHTLDRNANGVSNPVPHDADAEQQVAACATATAHGAQCNAWVNPDWCYTPACARLLAAVPQLADITPGSCADYSTEHIRAGAASVLADVDLRWLLELLRTRRRMWGTDGDAGQRVHDAWRARTAAQELADALDAVLGGTPPEHALQRLAGSTREGVTA